MNENISHSQVSMGSEKAFGFVFACVFLLAGLYPLLGSREPFWILLTIALCLVLVSILKPGLLRLPNTLWFKFGMMLGSIISPMIMFLIYALTVVPIGLVLRLLRKDPMNRRFDEETPSYWVDRDTPAGTMKDQF